MYINALFAGLGHGKISQYRLNNRCAATLAHTQRSVTRIFLLIDTFVAEFKICLFFPQIPAIAM